MSCLLDYLSITQKFCGCIREKILLSIVALNLAKRPLIHFLKSSISAISSLFFHEPLKQKYHRVCLYLTIAQAGRPSYPWITAGMKAGSLLGMLQAFWDPGYILWLLLSILLFWKNMSMCMSCMMRTDRDWPFTESQHMAGLRQAGGGEPWALPQKAAYGKRLKGL